MTHERSCAIRNAPFPPAALQTDDDGPTMTA